MIDILNGYGFKRNFKNVVVYPISVLATALNMQPFQVKEHYFLCVLDECLAQGEWHSEEIINGEIELYLPVYNTQVLLESLKREGFKVDEFQHESIIAKMLETQGIVSECFDMMCGAPSYKDPIRKHNLPYVKPLCESISSSGLSHGDTQLNIKTGETIKD